MACRWRRGSNTKQNTGTHTTTVCLPDRSSSATPVFSRRHGCKELSRCAVKIARTNGRMLILGVGGRETTKSAWCASNANLCASARLGRDAPAHVGAGRFPQRPCRSCRGTPPAARREACRPNQVVYGAAISACESLGRRAARVGGLNGL